MAARRQEPLDELVAGLLERCTFASPPAHVDLAVSGGADSLALLVLASGAGLRCTAHHVDHGLRHGSAAEADVVEAAAERFGAAFVAHRLCLDDGPNLEAHARAARFAALPVGVLTGHTADDQAETVLLNVLRGSGLDGLAAMGPAGHPLLGLRRADTESVCAAAGLAPVCDPTNDDPRFRRNRVRREVLPLLADVAQRDVVPLLTRLADLARDDAALLDALAAAIDPTSAAELVGASVPLARRALRRWLDDGHPPSRAEIDRVMEVAAGRRRATEVAGGRRVSRRAGRLSLQTGREVA